VNTAGIVARSRDNARQADNGGLRENAASAQNATCWNNHRRAARLLRLRGAKVDSAFSRLVD